MQSRGTFPEAYDNTNRGRSKMPGKYCAPTKTTTSKGSGLHVGRKGRMSGNHKQARGSK